MSLPVADTDTYMSTTLAQRRSKRLKHREYTIGFAACIQTDPLGYLAVLPTEILHHIFSFLKIQDLSILTLVSKDVRDLVMEYNESKEGFRKLLPPATPKATMRIKACHNFEKQRMSHFRDAGLLLKRSTCLNPTKDRLRKVDHFISKLSNSSRFHVQSLKSLFCYGKFLSTFLKGWEEKECLRAYVSITDVHSMPHKILSVLSRKPGYNCAMEYQIRSFFRVALLDQCEDEEDLAMWLNFILKPFPLVHQARVLYLLYGPLSPDHTGKSDMINWETMSETSLLPSPAETLASFTDFATALRALLSHHDWNDDDVISVLEELTACPDEWMTENIARLLIECGDPICMRVLVSKAINGKMQELGNIMVAFAVVRFHEQMPMSWLIHLIHQICGGMKNGQDTKSFLASISETFKDLMMSLPDMPDEDDELQLHHVAVAQADFMKELLLNTFS